jgi:sigma-E factor negative regulatory protein RseB
VTGWPRPARSMASLSVVIGLLGACAVLVVLADLPGRGPAGGRGASTRSTGAARQRRLAPDLIPAPAAPATPASSAGLRLMRAAAGACQSVAFHGTQVTARWGAAGHTTAVVQVWHEPGGALLAQFADPGARPGTVADQAEIMTITPALLTLMRQNYVITYAGPGSADGRPARVIEVRRRDGGLAARYWLDDATKLPLRRQLFDTRARVFSDDAFTVLSLGPGRPAPAPAPAPGTQVWAGPLSAAGRAALRASGWPVPRTVAGGMALFQATRSATKSGPVIELSYSDGLSVVSVFLQRGELPARMPGWRMISASGGTEIYALDRDDQSIAWSAGGYVITVISDAPAGAVNRAVTSLPHVSRPDASQPDFWDRIGRGMRRIASWADPLR